MEISKNLREQAQKSAEKFNLKLVKMSWKTSNGEKTLEVVLSKNGGVSLDDITKFTEDFNLYLDSETEIDFPYQLDCCSQGAEREIDLTELEENINQYMLVTTKLKKVLGTLIEVTNEDITLKYFLKGRPKKETIKKDDINKVELRVKF